LVINVGKNTSFLKINAEKRYFFEIFGKIAAKRGFTRFYLLLQA